MRRRAFLVGLTSLATALIQAREALATLLRGSGGTANAQIGTLTLTNNTAGTLTNQPINLGVPTAQGKVNPSNQHLAFQIGGVTIPSTTGFYGTWSDGTQATALAALNVPSLPTGSTTVAVIVSSGAPNTTLPAGLAVAQVKTNMLAHLDGLSGRPGGNNLIVDLQNFQTYKGTVQGSGHWQSKMSDALNAADCSVTYQGPTYIEFRSRANFVKDTVGGASHSFIQCDWYMGAHLDPSSGAVIAVRVGPKMYQGTTTAGVTQTAYWYDCTLQDGAGGILLNFKKTATFTDANITADGGYGNVSVNIASHGFQYGAPVYFTSTGTLPSPLIPFPGAIAFSSFSPQTATNVGGANYVLPIDTNHLAICDSLLRVQEFAEAGDTTAAVLTGGGGGTHTITQTIYHDRCSAWRVVDSRGNWTWSQNAPVANPTNNVDVVWDRNYLIKAGLVPPYDLSVGCSMANPDSTVVGSGDGWYSFYDKYVPGCGTLRTNAALDDTGDHGCLGLHPRWVSAYMQTGSTKWLDICRIMAAVFDLNPRQFRDSATKTVPNLSPTVVTGMTSEPTISYLSGGNRGGTKFLYDLPSSSGSIVPKTFSPIRGASDAGAHMGDFCSFIYWLEGDRGVLDSALYQWQSQWGEMLRGVENATFYLQPFSMDKQVGGTNYPCVSASYWGNYRQIGWNLRGLAHLLASFPRSEAEYNYLALLSSNNSAYHAALIAAMGATYRTQGAFRVLGASSSTNGDSIDDAFFHMYTALGIVMIHKVDPSTNWATVANQVLARYTAAGGAGNLQISIFPGGVIDDLFDSNNDTDPIDGWATAPGAKFTNNAPGFLWSSVSSTGALQAFQHVSVNFHNDGQTVDVDGIYDINTSASTPGYSNVEPLHVSSRFKFTGGILGRHDNATGSAPSAPPSGITYNQVYRFININTTNRTANLSIDGVTMVTWALANNGLRPFMVWQYGGIGQFADFPGGYAVIANSVYKLGVAEGFMGLTAGNTDFNNYLIQQSGAANAWNTDPRFHFRASR